MKRHFTLYMEILVFAIAIIVFLDYILNTQMIFGDITKAELIIVVTVTLLIHIVKSFRLYFALYGSEITRIQHLKLYCKVTPISILLPYKLGELYRMYCYGVAIKNLEKGIVIVLLDRFFDTMALLTIMFIEYIIGEGVITNLVIILMVLTIFLVFIYFSFPSFLLFWKRYLLNARASKHKIAGIKFLTSLNNLYCEIRNVIRGRGIILFGLSIMAWIMEVSFIPKSKNIFQGENAAEKINYYLLASINGEHNLTLGRFRYVSVIALAIGFIFFSIIAKKNSSEETSYEKSSLN